ncbi:MAG: TonB-dependent receptor [Sphingomonadales bacterium]|nr:TonB-dependent receptor [Sphingomonadales bacterium]
MARGGSFHQKMGPPLAKALFAALLTSLFVVPALARRSDVAVSIGQTTLAVAIPLLARQCGCDIVSVEPGVGQVKASSVVGSMTIETALRKLLARTGYRAITVGEGNYRIVAATIYHSQHHPRRATEAPSRPSPDLVVTASKQFIPLMRYPGTIIAVSDLPDSNDAVRAPSIDELSRVTPMLQNTALGDGRNKTFIRGIADSSFNGATQSTASTYFGDVQLGYSGPGPGLRLHDVRSVEVMEGPQGTLYGAGSIGGIIRITPNPVVLDRVEGSVAGGISQTVRGAPGYDLSGMINVPLVNDRIGLRAVAYRQRIGGYIDANDRSDINGMNISGGRVELRADLLDGWIATLGGLTQTIGAAGAQYAERPAGPLHQYAIVPQPFSNRIRLGRLVLNKNWDNGMQFTSATGVVGIRSADVYDATGSPGTFGRAIYDDGRTDLLISQETRLSQSFGGGLSWLVGFTLVYDRNAESRALGMVDTPADIIGVTNVTKTASVFGEVTIPLLPNLSITAGNRTTRARTDGEPSINPRQTDFAHGRSSFRFDPTLAMSWLLSPNVAIYGRLQSGFRPSGLAVARGIGRVADFDSDTIRMAEVGFRLQRRGQIGIALTTAISYAHWSAIQADLINRRGQPYTANIGNADIYALEGTADWVPVVGLNTTLSFLYTQNRVDGPIAQTSVRANRRLPITPPFAANLQVGYRWDGRNGFGYRLAATGRYVGRSVLGSGDFLDISQGRYTVIDLVGSVHAGKATLSLGIDNLTNARANRFSFGNPFTFFRRDQMTPLQPLTVRVGMSFTL